MTKKKRDQRSQKLMSTLADFKVEAELVDVNVGPVVTLYEVKLAAGIKSSKLVGLAPDIARVMSAVSCRVAQVPGKDVMGIELPNDSRKTVPLDPLFETPEFKGAKMVLPVALGSDIGGSPVVVDIARMPHLLMAGTTGSGKSVAVNTLIVALLKHKTPDEVRFIMIDPKQLEMASYADIPHLLSPVVTDSTKAVQTLHWVVSEMEDRYRKMSLVGVRNIGGYNASGLEKLPYIVVIIDEVADLMMVAGKEVEAMIQRLAQMARAAGIHVVMATQRPSTDVITGTLKANFPTRISFQVTSQFDSRTILGEGGAETLLGMGDMLYMASGKRPMRVHGAFISDEDVLKLADKLRASGTPNYVDIYGEQQTVAEPDPVQDELYTMAKQFVLLEGIAIAGALQRRLYIPYLEAHALLDRMEAEGLVGPADSVGWREVLVL